MDKVIQRVRDRCERICGKKQSECFVNKKEQINCMADMIINKASSIIMALGTSLQMDDHALLRDTAKESLSAASELSNWIKYLQIVPDLFALSTLVLDADSVKKRTEIRYPMPKDFEGMIKVIYDNTFEARLINFSQNGMQIILSQPLEKGTVIKCHLLADIIDENTKPFKATAMYCVPKGNSYMCGAQITDMRNSGFFNFFSLVHQLMMEITLIH